jgi:c-di-GMP-binding flagellar brake protein YcgR
MPTDLTRRRFSRAPFKGTVALWRDRVPHLIVATDLSAGGLFLTSDAPLGEGSLCTLRVSLPGERGFTVLGRVARNQAGRAPLRCGGVAVEFLDIAPRDRERLQRYVARFRRERAA